MFSRDLQELDTLSKLYGLCVDENESYDHCVYSRQPVELTASLDFKTYWI